MGHERSRQWPGTVRPAVASDLDVLRSIEAEYGNLGPWPTRPDFLDHEFEAGRIAVAELGRETVGFAGVYAYPELTYLADLFVRPGLVGRGIGTALLESILPDAGAVVTFASSDPRAVPLYERFGLRSLIPLRYLAGGRDAVERLPGGPGSPEAGPDDRAEVIDLDAALSGRRRPEEIGFLTGLQGATTLAERAGGRIDAYAAIRTVMPSDGAEPEAFVGPCGSRTEEGFGRIVLAAVRSAAAAAERIHLTCLGSHPLGDELLRAGFRVDGTDTLMAKGSFRVDGGRYAPNPELG